MGGLKSKLRRSKSSSRKENGASSASSGKTRSNSKKTKIPESQSARKTVDPRLPFSNYRQIFSIRNAWKAVTRSMTDCAKETLIRFFHDHPNHKERFPDIKHITDEEEMRTNDDFENVAMDIYQVFDDVINSLENVDIALKDIRQGAISFPLNKQMIKDMQPPFVDTIKLTLGSDRFTEATEENFKLLYQFVEEEIGKHLTEVEVVSEIVGNLPNIDETNSEHAEAPTGDSDSDPLANTEPQKQAELNPAFDEEHSDKCIS